MYHAFAHESVGVYRRTSVTSLEQDTVIYRETAVSCHPRPSHTTTAGNTKPTTEIRYINPAVRWTTSETLVIKRRTGDPFCDHAARVHSVYASAVLSRMHTIIHSVQFQNIRLFYCTRFAFVVRCTRNQLFTNNWIKTIKSDMDNMIRHHMVSAVGCQIRVGLCANIASFNNKEQCIRLSVRFHDFIDAFLTLFVLTLPTSLLIKTF